MCMWYNHAIEFLNRKNMKHKVVKLQFFIGLTAIFFVAVISQKLNILISAGFGFVLAYVPTVVYSKIAFAKGLVVLPHVALLQHQKAMLIKFILNLLLFGLVFLLYKQCNFMALLFVYFMTLSAYWISLIW